MIGDTLIDLFTDRLTAVGGLVSTAATSGDAVDAILAEETTELWIGRDVETSAPDLLNALRERGIDPRTPTSPADVRDQPHGLVIARAAIAETGSVLLVEPDVGDRSITLMTQSLTVLCRSDLLLASLTEAAPILRELSTPGPSYATFVTGPSRTADIERQLTVGVQGPGRLHLVFVGDLT